ncbi:class D beta-lactamase [Microvirga arsenatis]|uniref:Beta-lactamase n=1 Tax=Microvirga arsenatis TaxID=2692265 RepID=A0ABW9YWC8_9HYPH|nr:class D beta-lactamase [Microvirga arsenatis]NBJ10621.1 class D beta-lactamase [Microvirga arsenatis]NBJ24480.1 class D beta-lactamase [Microvirga arsenatis]
MHAVRLALLFGILLVSGQVLADTCTLVTELETGRILKREGDCERRNSPASTFKVPLSLMGYDAGILKTEDEPAWPYKPEYKAWNEAWRKTITPRPWLRDSVVWYSQALTREMGMERFRRYVDAFQYGNRDVSGDKGKANGLTHAWLSSSLQISPVEQIGFLRKLLKRELPVSRRAHDMTLAIMPTFPLPDGWIAYGKTGSGFQPSANGSPDRERQFGWFVGWAQKGERRILFARLIRDERKETSVASFRARDSLLAELPALIAD